MHWATSTMPRHDEENKMRPATYEVRIEGAFPLPTLAELDGMRLVGQDPAETVLRGVIADQSALLGLVRHIEDAGCVVRHLYVVGGAEAVP